MDRPSRKDCAHRRSIRLRAYDYSEPGAYLVNVCTEGRRCLFGDIIGDEMVLNAAGTMIARRWDELPERFASAKIDEFIVMPNHFHGIVVITEPQQRAPAVGADLVSAHPRGPGETGVPSRRFGGPQEGLSRIMQLFKSITTADYARFVREENWAPFVGRPWQLNYYEHVIRSDIDLNRIRRYILENPLRWALDCENPEVAGT